MRFPVRMSLTHRPLLGGFAVLLVGMLALGTWLSGAIEKRVIHHEGELFALYVDSVLSDQVQSLASGGVLRDTDMLGLGKRLFGARLGARIVAFTVGSA